MHSSKIYFYNKWQNNKHAIFKYFWLSCSWKVNLVTAKIALTNTESNIWKNKHK